MLKKYSKPRLTKHAHLKNVTTFSSLGQNISNAVDLVKRSKEARERRKTNRG